MTKPLSFTLAPQIFLELEGTSYFNRKFRFQLHLGVEYALINYTILVNKSTGKIDEPLDIMMSGG